MAVTRLRVAMKQFIGLLFITVIVNIILYFCSMPHKVHPPDYARSKIYMTMNCEDGRRLGNMMFNYASLLGISHSYNVTALMSASFPLYKYFKLTALKSVDVENSLGSYINYEEYGRRACAYDVGVKHFKKATNYKLNGYFQSWKYFEKANYLLHKEFVFQDDILRTARSFHEELLSSVAGDVVVVGIHIRRGDNLDPYFSSYGYTTPGTDYFQKAMEYFKSKYNQIVFIVCSDDIEWSKTHVVGSNVFYSERLPDYVDLAVLSLCQHVIVSVGSFGWWAGWLANGTVIYYSGWPRHSSKLEYMVTKTDYFPPHWIPLP